MSIKRRKEIDSKSKLLVQLPNDASTSKYPKTFPQPLNLLSMANENDMLIDAFFMSFNKSDFQIEKMLKEQVEKTNQFDGEVIINAGDYAPDAHYDKFFKFFLSQITRKATVIGTYPEILGEKKIKELYPLLDVHLLTKVEWMFPRYEYFLKRMNAYPRVGDKIKLSIRASVGCPRKCAMCPVPQIHNGYYDWDIIEHIINTIESGYSYGARYFTFIDDNISISPKFKLLLFELKKLKLKGATYHVQEGFDLSTFDAELARMLKELRFDDIKIAFENIKQDFIKKIQKTHITRESIRKAIYAIKKHDLKVKAFLLMGLDETREDVIENIKFFSNNGLTLRCNIIRDYRTPFACKFQRKLSDKEFASLKALAYSASFFTENKMCLFDGFETLERNGYSVKENIDSSITKITGKCKFGFQTSRFERGLKYMFGENVKLTNNGDSILIKKIPQKKGLGLL